MRLHKPAVAKLLGVILLGLAATGRMSYAIAGNWTMHASASLKVPRHKSRQAALPRIETMLEIEQALHLSVQDIVATRMNRANVLKEVQRFDEAQSELKAVDTLLAAVKTQALTQEPE